MGMGMGMCIQAPQTGPMVVFSIAHGSLEGSLSREVATDELGSAGLKLLVRQKRYKPQMQAGGVIISSVLRVSCFL